jgi:hypothetical protein
MSRRRISTLCLVAAIIAGSVRSTISATLTSYISKEGKVIVILNGEMVLLAAILLTAAALAADTRSVETQCKMAVAKVIQATGMELREISKTSPYLPESKIMAFALKHPLVPDDDYAAELNCLTGDSLNFLITSVNEYPPSAWFNLVAKGGAALTGASVQTVRKAIDECYAKTLGSEAGEITEIVKQLFTVDCSRMPSAGITITVFQPLNLP